MECLARAKCAGFTRQLKCLEDREYVEKYFLFSAAPVLTGAKPAALISLRRCCKAAWMEKRQKLLTMTGLWAEELYESEVTFSISIYDRELLSAALKTPTAKSFLNEYGYPAEGNLCSLLDSLKSRFRGGRFPHEIGVFLGYPPEDVDTFIEKSGRDFLCCRYWKVYHNEERARETFRFIDEAKERAINLLTRQIPNHTVVKILKAI